MDTLKSRVERISEKNKRLKSISTTAALHIVHYRSQRAAQRSRSGNRPQGCRSEGVKVTEVRRKLKMRFIKRLELKRNRMIMISGRVCAKTLVR